MSESVLPASEEGVLAHAPVNQISGGSMLREAREAEGLSIEALAVLLKVPAKKLEALEADRFDLLPDTVFARALASSVCRALKLDLNSILERLPNSAVTQLKTDESGINVPFRADGGASGWLSWGRRRPKPLGVAVALLLAGVLVLLVFPDTVRINVSGVQKDEVSAAVTSFPSATSATAEKQVVTEVVPIQVPTALTSSVAVPGPVASTGLVVFKARGASWVEVVDASGVVQLRKTVTVGETVAASGALPLSVVVGKADVTDVQVRGQSLDLTRIAKDNIARFEVK